LEEVYPGIETDDECFVFAALEGRIEEFDRSFFLKPQFVANAAAGVHEQRDRQGEVRFTAEVRDRLSSIVLEDLEVFLLEVRYKLAFPVRDGKQDVNQVDLYRNGLLVLRLCRRSRRGGRCRWSLLRRPLCGNQARQTESQHETNNNPLHK